MLLHLQYNHFWIICTKDFVDIKNDSAIVKEMKIVMSNDLRTLYTTMLKLMAYWINVIILILGFILFIS